MDEPRGVHHDAGCVDSKRRRCADGFADDGRGDVSLYFEKSTPPFDQLGCVHVRCIGTTPATSKSPAQMGADGTHLYDRDAFGPRAAGIRAEIVPLDEQTGPERGGGGGASWNRTSDLSIIREIREISLRPDVSCLVPNVLLIVLGNFVGETHQDVTGRAGVQIVGTRVGTVSRLSETTRGRRYLALSSRPISQGRNVNACLVALSARWCSNAGRFSCPYLLRPGVVDRILV